MLVFYTLHHLQALTNNIYIYIFLYFFIFFSLLTGFEVTTSEYSRAFYTSGRSYKNSALKTASYYFYRGVHEPWEWYDKCAKRKRNKGKSFRVNYWLYNNFLVLA